MNKKRIEGFFWILLGLFLLVLLSNKASIQSNGSSDKNLLIFFLKMLTLLFGKLAWFITVSILVIGGIIAYRGDFQFTRIKVIGFIGWFFSWSLLLIKKALTGSLAGDNFTVAGQKLLEIGFNGKSGGVLGAIVSMPLYKIMYSMTMGFLLTCLLLVSIYLVFKDYIELGYEIIVGILKYHKSDEYKEKKALLKAKRETEKLKRTNYKLYQKEKLKEKIIQSRKEKLSFELSKKPKEKFLQKTEVYTPEEMKVKEKEWKEASEKRVLPKDNVKKKLSEEKVVLKEESVKVDNKENSKVEKTEEINKKEATVENEKAEKTKLEIVVDDKKNKKDKKEKKTVEEELPEFPKIEAFENIDTIENQKKINEKLEKINQELENGRGYNELVKKAISAIFKEKPMDNETKDKIEKSIVENVSHLENVLKEFGVDAKVVNYEYGPTITRYEITIPTGTKVSKVTNLSDDIAMNLAAESIRIEAPIPGKNTIGIETPNKIKEPVYFSNIIKNKELEKGDLNVILGKDVVGRDKIIDIAKTPHLLIAGQTGSGKSVAINTLISTLISKKSEKEVRFIMVDPKMVELMPYNGIPHLLVPVIIDPHQAALALKWAVNEMENRYKLLVENGVRNITSYNKLNFVEKMPFIVIIIDELADLMMTVSGGVEESIVRIAQKARAVGIHLVVATQRPSTDIVTGLIKANLPSRISFALRSQVDSRTILDVMGAEKLLGKGDMLLLANGSSKLERIQGAFISDEEVNDLANTLKMNSKVQYRDDILVEHDENTLSTLDSFFENAVDIVRQENRVSISLLQRKLSIGFPRASKIYEQLKENGIIDDNNQIVMNDFERV